jgi:cobalt-zinc-cadmium efflux system membrane fusion protein
MAQEPESQAKKPAEGGHAHGHGHGHGHSEGQEEGPEGVIKMPAERIATAKIEVAPIKGGTLAHRLTVPGTVMPDSNRIARVAAKVVGTVAELNKRLGDTVAKGEVVAVLDSREVADAKSEYLAALVNFDLQKTLFEREQSLFQKSITAEQQFLRARTTFTEAQLRADLARQKLYALGVNDKEVAGLSRQSMQGLQRYELRSPIAGRVVERLVDLGAPVGGEGQAKELYVVADLSSVWIELSVPTADLPSIKEGQRLAITAGANGKPTEGRVVFISPMLNQETRSARVIAAIENKDLTWRPGSYVSAQITIEEQPVELRVPRTALQSLKGEQVVFVRTPEGFEKREVVLGKADDQAVEVVFGLDPGESIAVANTFVLKAELGKAEAEHAH